MAETLKIENFGPIKKANLKLGKTTVFIGEQSSGKSTIAKLIAIFRDAQFIEDIFIQREEFQFDIFVDKLRVYQIHNYINPSSSIIFNGNIFDLKLSDSKVALYFDKDKTDPQLFELINNYKNKLHQEYNGRLFLYNGNINVAAMLYASVGVNAYVHSERILYSTLSDSIFSLLRNDIPFPKFISKFLSDIEKNRNFISNIKIEALNIEYERIGNQDWVTHGNNLKLRLSETSSAVQANVPLFIILEGPQFRNKETPTTFIVEEPELNLFPSSQLKVINHLSQRTHDKNYQLVITTHSPYVLTALNNLLFAHKTAAKKPYAKKKVNKIIPEASWLNPDEFRAYYVGKGTAESIIDEDTGLIGDNHLDDASYDAQDTFYQLMQIYKG